MIILPNRKLSRGRYLMPIPRRQWMPSSQADKCQTRFRLRARRPNGSLAWEGWFEDRDDADAFIFALALGTLKHDRRLWRLSSPEWRPDTGEDLIYRMATLVSFTFQAGADTWTSPEDWNNDDNLIEAIGGGASGAAAKGNGSYRATGGGGGGYHFRANFTFANPGVTTVDYYIGNGGASVTRSTNGVTNGNAGEASTFDSSTPASGNPRALGGAGGTAGTGSRNGGAGGVNTTNGFSGGNGGNTTIESSDDVIATGGGAAGSPAGPGGNGVNTAATGVTATNGGNTSGTGGGSGSGNNNGSGTSGGNGSQLGDGVGAGGGGGGATRNPGSSTNTTAGSGGNWGGGGGGACAEDSNNVISGAGRRGVITVTYNPIGGPYRMFLIF